MKALLSVLCCCLSISATAQTIVIDGLRPNGLLSWNGDPGAFASYHVEWAPSVKGPWSASWDGLTNLAASNGTMTVAVPMFYRVVGSGRAPLPGEDCTNAMAAASGINSGTTAGYADNFNAAAQGYPAPGRDRVYRVTVPANHTLNARLTPTGPPSLDVVLLVYSGAVDCSQVASHLLTAADAAPAGGDESITWNNNDSAPVEVLVVADSIDPGSSGEHELTLSFSGNSPGDACAAAQRIGPGFYSNQSTAGYSADRGPGPGCVATAGPDRYFRITIPSGQTLHATITPTEPWDVVVNILHGALGCTTQPPCLTGSNEGCAGDPESIDYTNISGSYQDVLIVVAGLSAGDAGPFNLEVSIAP